MPLRVWQLLILLLLGVRITGRACSYTYTPPPYRIVEGYRYALDIPVQTQDTLVQLEVDLTREPTQNLLIVDELTHASVEGFWYVALEEKPTINTTRYRLLFPVKKGRVYTLYHTRDDLVYPQGVTYPLPDGGQITNYTEVSTVPMSSKNAVTLAVQSNDSPHYAFGDFDEDGVTNNRDVCWNNPNPDQVYDQTKCDYDKNGILDSAEKCAPYVPESVRKENLVTDFCVPPADQCAEPETNFPVRLISTLKPLWPVLIFAAGVGLVFSYRKNVSTN